MTCFQLRVYHYKDETACVKVYTKISITTKNRDIFASFQALQTYFRGLIFVLQPEYIIAIAYCSRLLLQCPDIHGLIFRFWALCD